MVIPTETTSPHQPTGPTDAPAVVFDNVRLAFDDNEVLRGISFTLPTAHMLVLIGPSGTGKSVLLKLILGLIKPDSGSIHVNGERIDTKTEVELMRVRGGIGMLFQENALFDSLTVADNVGYRLYEETDTPHDEVDVRVADVLERVGLGEYGERMPSELSGGQRRRVAIARAVASRPALLLLDDPTSGLDPITARMIEGQIVQLRDLERVTSILVTHELPDAFYIATHRARRVGDAVEITAARPGDPDVATFIVLNEGRIYFQGTVGELSASTDPYLRSLLSGWVPPLVRQERDRTPHSL